MVNYRSFVVGCAVIVVAAGTARAQTQGVPPNGRPAVSPYLNLNRRGASPGINYYNLVRPQTDFFSSIQQLQQQVGANRTAITGIEQGAGQAGLPPTGFVPQFQSHRAYFQTYSSGGGGSPLMGGSRPAAAASRAAPRSR
jgi:hypothetical protein